jgi:hypothetical protein
MVLEIIFGGFIVSDFVKILNMFSLTTQSCIFATPLIRVLDPHSSGKLDLDPH